MALFRTKEEKFAITLFKQRQAFTKQYVYTVKHIVNSFQQLGLTDAELNDRDMRDSLYILHDTIVVLSQAAIKDKNKEEIAANLLSFVEDARVDESNLSISEFRKSVIDAYKAYTETLKKFRENDNGMHIPILAALKTIQPLAEFYADRGRLDFMLQLPLIEQDILISYKKYWVKNL